MYSAVGKYYFSFGFSGTSILLDYRLSKVMLGMQNLKKRFLRALPEILLKKDLDSKYL